MARLPSPEDYGLSTPRPSRDIYNATPVRVAPDMGPAQLVSDIGAIMKQETDKLDALKAEDALNKIRQARLDLTMGDKGAYQVKGGDVLTPTYMSGYKSQLNTTVEGVMSGLSAPQQARLKSHADREVLGLQSDILRHSMTESERYKGIVREGTATTATNAGIVQWQDPIGFDNQRVALENLVMATAKEQGISDPDTLMAMRQKAMSPMITGAVTSALDARDLPRAEALLKANTLVIDPGTRIKLNEHVTKLRETEQVRTDAQTFLTTVVLPAQTVEGKLSSVLVQADMERNITQAESRGQHLGKDGKVILGPVIASGPSKGQQAVGAHQIMPASAEQDAKEAGIPWDKELFYSPTPEGKAYHDKLQKAHVTRLMKMFDKPEEIAAAYNAGEGNVIEAKKRFDRFQQAEAAARENGTLTATFPGRPGSYNPAKDGPISFLDFLPQPGETKPYVSRVLGATKAAPDIVQPTAREVEAQMAARYPGRPDLAKEATSLVTHQLKTMEEARKVEIETTTESIYKYMGQGRTFAEVPPSLLNKLPPVEQDKVRSTFEAHIAGTPRDSSQGLLSQINSDPNYLARVPTSAWTGPMKTQLSAYDWKRFDTQRSALLGGNVAEAESLDNGTLHTILSSRLRMLEIDPTPKETDTAGQARVNSARAILDQSVLDRQKQIGRKLTEVEMLKHVDTLFRQDVRLQSTFAGFAYGDANPVAVLSLGISDVPSASLSDIKSLFKANGIPKPTDAQLLTYYKQQKLGLR
jgi:hypothetical protein